MREEFKVPIIKTPQDSRGAINNLAQNARNPQPVRQKVALKPGHSALDWELLKKKQIRAPPQRITKQELSQHNTRDDCWMEIDRKVYNISVYLDFHPGGDEILLKSAGKDGSLLFKKYHPWVNAERILDGCFVGFLMN